MWLPKPSYFSFASAARQILSDPVTPGGPRRAKNWPRRLHGPFSGQGSSAGFYGLGNGSGFCVGDMSLGVEMGFDNDHLGTLMPFGAVAVGTAIAGRPPHRSRRAVLPHRAPTLDD